MKKETRLLIVLFFVLGGAIMVLNALSIPAAINASIMGLSLNVDFSSINRAYALLGAFSMIIGALVGLFVKVKDDEDKE